jgi:hypothetical protein
MANEFNRIEPTEPTPTVTNTGKPADTCCGGPVPAWSDACCVEDAEVKSAGGAGCGCTPAPRQAPATACCPN